MKQWYAFLIFLLLFTHYSWTQQKSLIGKIIEVIPKQSSTSGNDVFIKFKSLNDTSIYLIDDFYTIYMIEYAHKILLEDYIHCIDTMNIIVRFDNITKSARKVNGLKQTFITDWKKIYPKYPDTTLSFLYEEINPGIPEEDFYQRFITVPVSYKDSSRGTFKLYYELCSDYDPKKPTILIPTDGQRTLSQVGWADRYKKMFNLEYNTVTYEYRGMFCSKIPLIEKKGADWKTIYGILNSDNVVEDIERIRRDLLGDKPFYILGGSGTAMIGLKYIAKYPQNVKRAFLMSFFKDARGSSESGVMFFTNFLKENTLLDAFFKAIENPSVNKEHLLFLIQRLLYFNKEETKNLIIDVSQGDLNRYRKYTRMVGTVDYFIRSAQKYKPWTVVFMFETNIPTQLDKRLDINYPFLKMAEPLLSVFENPEEYKKRLFYIKNLETVNTEILLVAGTMDQVAPVSELKRIHNELPNSKLALFKAYHSLQAPEGARQCRNQMTNIFFKYGFNSDELENFLQKSKATSGFVGWEEKDTDKKGENL
ncbi:MAG: hypothetical protein Kow00108_16970 [Calditrichia bacterium]